MHRYSWFRECAVRQAALVESAQRRDRTASPATERGCPANSPLAGPGPPSRSLQPQSAAHGQRRPDTRQPRGAADPARLDAARPGGRIPAAGPLRHTHPLAPGAGRPTPAVGQHPGPAPLAAPRRRPAPSPPAPTAAPCPSPPSPRLPTSASAPRPGVSAAARWRHGPRGRRTAARESAPSGPAERGRRAEGRVVPCRLGTAAEGAGGGAGLGPLFVNSVTVVYRETSFVAAWPSRGPACGNSTVAAPILTPNCCLLWRPSSGSMAGLGRSPLQC